ncbi:unnamed protein product [Rhodiola kirilowii]
MENCNDGAPAKPDEQVQENEIENDKADESCSKVEPTLAGISDKSDANVTGQPVKDATRSSNGEGSCSLTPDEIKQIVANFLETISAENLVKGPPEGFRPLSGDFNATSNGKEAADHGINEFTPVESSKYKSRFSRFSSGKKRKTSSKLSRRKRSRLDSRNSTILQSRGGSEVPELTTDAEHYNRAAHAGSSKERRRGKKKRLRENTDDVFTKMRKQMRYTLNKIQYEQSLIDAYGGEGWKGLSVDKLKPEKELQRATSEILRYKLRLRDIFQRLATICAEGSFPESMFDSEGLLDSEDIYCTICGWTELSADNDIVLCDGECNRAFHQMCLKPPLLTEEIPPDDQGWLCPGCDCKFDCTEMLNDFFGTDLSMKDDWTSIFPEAATTAAGASAEDEILGLPSDDSEDDDFDPENLDVDEKVEVDKSGEGHESSEGEESTSDESDFTSDSEDLGDFIKKEQLEGNPLDDSDEEDDDYDPDAPQPDEQNKEESSNSDFTSASDDFVPEADNAASTINENSQELLAAVETEQESPGPASKKRDLERLDYKRLYDETYGNASSDSSDDEEWTDVGPSKKIKNKNERSGSTFPKDNIRTSEDDEQSTDAERKLQESDHGTPRSCKKLKSSFENGSTSKGSRSTLGETATQKLNEAFQMNQYPERAVKENLAKELGIPYQKVDKWFGNARWSFNHPLHARTVSKSNVSKKSPALASSDSKADIINKSSNNHSSQTLPDAKATVDDNSIKISSPSNPTSFKAAGKSGQIKNSHSRNSSAADKTIQGHASASPPLQSNKRRSARLQETPTSNSNKAEVPTNNEEGSANVGDSRRQKVTTSTPNSKPKGKKAFASSDKAAKVLAAAASKEVVAQSSPSTAVESMENESETPKTRKSGTKLFPGNQESPMASGAGTKGKIQTRSRK